MLVIDCWNDDAWIDCWNDDAWIALLLIEPIELLQEVELGA